MKSAHKRKSLGSYKKKLWKLFSEYVRMKAANPDGFVICVTCGRSLHWKEAHASHFLPGRNNGILFDVRNCHPSCMRCNIFLAGNLSEYYPFMLKTYGGVVIEELKVQKLNPPKLDRDWYEKKIEEYTALVILQRRRLGL